jgi:aminoglycoside phosphotransferase (APT) family kinase protein
VTRIAIEPAAVERLVHRHLGDGVTVGALQRLSGGASRETWSFDVTHPGGRVEGLVLRRDPGNAVGETTRDTEFELVRAAHTAGVCAPHARFLLEPDDALGHGFVMDRVEGETIPRKILRDDQFASTRPELTAQCARIAAQIHALPLAGLPALPVHDAAQQIAQYRGLLDGFGEPHPALELALRWLEERAPRLTAARLVHGDYRNGNFIVGPEGIRAVLDWELAHLGDPVEDLGWLCVKSWRFGSVELEAGGFGSADELLDAYNSASGTVVTLDALRYWEVMGTVKWGVICELQAFTHLNGIVRSVELAALGRRVAEMEWDVLELVG